ncbi:MAG: hypothetical protein AAFX09_06560 [Pseudomonadota bacterium]
MTADDLKSDITYLRELAEAGEQAPSLGGRFAVWWGSLSALTLIAHWAILDGRAPVGPDMLLMIWLGYVVIGSAGSAFLGRSLRNKPGAGSTGNRTASAVWTACGGVTFAYFFSVLAGVMLGRIEPVFFNTILPVALLGYAIAWFTTALIGRDRVSAVNGAAALIGMAACVILVTDAAVYLTAALAIFLSSVPAGIAMMRAEPRELV